MTFFKNHLYFPLDKRSLAAFRIMTGLVLLIDLWGRYQNIEAHYTDLGVLPIKVLEQYWKQDFLISLHLFPSSIFGIKLLFLISTIFALLFTLGFFTHLTAIGSWLLLVSIQNRNPLVLYAGDIALRMSLLFSIFLPLSQCWAIQIKNCIKTKYKISNFGFPFICLITSIYLFGAMEKISGTGWEKGTALFDGLGIQHLATTYGVYLRTYPLLTQMLSYLTIAMEIMFPMLLVISFKQATIRTIIVVSFIFLHLGMSIFLEIGLFPIIMCSIWVIFLPFEFWKLSYSFFNKRIFPDQKKSHVFFKKNLIVLFLTLQMLLLNFIEPWTTNSYINKFYWNPITIFFRLDQKWSMFKSPETQLDGRFEFFHEEKQLKLMKLDLLKDHRWIKLAMSAAKGNDHAVEGILKWSCYLEGLPHGAGNYLLLYEYKKSKFPNTSFRENDAISIGSIPCP